MTNRTFNNLVRKINFISNINKSSLGHFAVLKQEDEDGQVRTVARVVATSYGESPRKFSVTSSRLPTLTEGSGRTLTGIEGAVLRGQML